MWKTSKPNIEKLIEKKDVQGLIALLGDPDSLIVAAAARALGEIGEASGVPPLKEKAIIGNLAAISALGLIGGDEATTILVHLTEREDFPHHVLAGTIQALGETGDPQIVDHIKRFLVNEDDWILRETLAVLKKFLSEKEVEFLIREQQELLGTDGVKKTAVMHCKNCGENFTHQQAQVDSITSKDGSLTRYLFLCPQCGANLLDSKGQPIEQIERHPIEQEEEEETEE